MMDAVIKSDMKINEGSLRSGEPVFMHLYESSSKECEKLDVADLEKERKSKSPEFINEKTIKYDTILDVLEASELKNEDRGNKCNTEKGCLKRKLSEVCDNEECTFFGKPNPYVFLKKCQKKSQEQNTTDNGNVQFVDTENNSECVDIKEPPIKKIKILEVVEKEGGGAGLDISEECALKGSNEDKTNEKEHYFKHTKKISYYSANSDDDINKNNTLSYNKMSTMLKGEDKKKELEIECVGLFDDDEEEVESKIKGDDDDDKEEELIYDGDDDEEEDDYESLVGDVKDLITSKASTDVVQISSGESAGEEEEDDDEESREDDDDDEEEEEDNDMVLDKFIVKSQVITPTTSSHPKVPAIIIASHPNPFLPLPHHTPPFHTEANPLLNPHRHLFGPLEDVTFECSMAMLEASEVRAGRGLVTLSIEALSVAISLSTAPSFVFPPPFPSCARLHHSSVVYWKWLPVYGMKVLEVVFNRLPGSLEGLFEFFRVPYADLHGMPPTAVANLKFYFSSETSKPFMQSAFESFFLQPKPPYPYSKHTSNFNGTSLGHAPCGRHVAKRHSVLCRSVRRKREGVMQFYRPLAWPFIKWIHNPLHPTLQASLQQPPQQPLQQPLQQHAYVDQYNKFYLQQQQQQQLHMQYYNNHSTEFPYHQLPISPYSSQFNNNNFRIPLQHVDHHSTNKIDNIYNIFGHNSNRPPSPIPVVSGFTGKNIKLFTYQPPNSRGGIGISNEDLFCLNDGEYLNDVIIDFYLKYLMEELMSQEDKQRTHVFSSFFYGHLVSNNNSHNSILTAEEQRHSKVKRWTRSVDIFSKDFIIVPINESYHWFLAIICFPTEKNKNTKTNSAPMATADPITTTKAVTITTGDITLNSSSSVISDASATQTFDNESSNEGKENIGFVTMETSPSVAMETTNSVVKDVNASIASSPLPNSQPASPPLLITSSSSVILFLRGSDGKVENYKMNDDDNEDGKITGVVGRGDVGGGKDDDGGVDSNVGKGDVGKKGNAMNLKDVRSVVSDHNYEKTDAVRWRSGKELDGGLSVGDEGRMSDTASVKSGTNEIRMYDEGDEEEFAKYEELHCNGGEVQSVVDACEVGGGTAEVVLEEVINDLSPSLYIHDFNVMALDPPNSNDARVGGVGDDDFTVTKFNFDGDGGDEGLSKRDDDDDVSERDDDDDDASRGEGSKEVVGSEVSAAGTVLEEGEDGCEDDDDCKKGCGDESENMSGDLKKKISVDEMVESDNNKVDAEKGAEMENDEDSREKGSSKTGVVTADVTMVTTADMTAATSSAAVGVTEELEGIQGVVVSRGNSAVEEDGEGDREHSNEIDEENGKEEAIVKEGDVKSNASQETTSTSTSTTTSTTTTSPKTTITTTTPPTTTLPTTTTTPPTTTLPTTTTTLPTTPSTTTTTTTPPTTPPTTTTTAPTTTPSTTKTPPTTTKTKPTTTIPPTTTTTTPNTTIPPTTTTTPPTTTTTPPTTTTIPPTTTTIPPTTTTTPSTSTTTTLATTPTTTSTTPPTTPTIPPTTPTTPPTTTTTPPTTPKADSPITPDLHEEASADRNPCILIFDSLKGESRFDVVNILRQYLQVEWNTRKRDTEGERSFDRNNMKGAMVNCPQQSNTTDCGIYMLQFIESFFRDKVQDFTLPLHLEDWFSADEVMSKRIKLASLIMSLKDKLNGDLVYNPHDDGCFNITSLSDAEEADDDDDDDLSSIGDCGEGRERKECIGKGVREVERIGDKSDEDGLNEMKESSWDDDDEDLVEVAKNEGNKNMKGKYKEVDGGDDAGKDSLKLIKDIYKEDEEDEDDMDIDNDDDDEDDEVDKKSICDRSDREDASRISHELIMSIIDDIDTGEISKKIDGENVSLKDGNDNRDHNGINASKLVYNNLEKELDKKCLKTTPIDKQKNNNGDGDKIDNAHKADSDKIDNGHNAGVDKIDNGDSNKSNDSICNSINNN